MRKTLWLNLFAMLFFGLGALVVFAMQGSPFLGILSNVFVDFLSFCAALSAFFAYFAVSSKSEFKLPSLVLALSFAMLFLGDMLWTLFENVLGIALPVGSFADFAWIIGYVLILVSLVMFIRMMFITPKTKLISGVIAAIFALWFVVYRLPDMVNLASVINHAYVAMDIIIIGLISMILVPLVASRNRFVAFWILFASAFLVRIVFDVLFAEFVDADMYWSGHFIDVIYMLSYAVFVFAADYRAKLVGELK